MFCCCCLFCFVLFLPFFFECCLCPTLYFHTRAFNPMGSCLRVSITGIKHSDQKQPGRKGVYFISELAVHQPGKSGQELKAVTWSQEMEQRHGGELLWGSLLMACPACFLIPSSTAFPPTPITNQERTI